MDAIGNEVASSGGGEIVLVIEDEPLIRMLAVEVLTDSGYRVIEADDGASGLKILSSDQTVDLLITDVGLPGGMNGRQVVEAARSKRPDLKVLYMTGAAETDVVAKGSTDTRIAVITKPFVLEAFAHRVRDLIEL